MIDILRKINGVETIIASVSNKNASHKQVIMGADEVSVGIVVSQFIDVKDGDYINHNGIVYTCNRDAEYTKSSDVNYQYNLLFEHPFYRLLDKLFTYPLTGSAVFTLTGKLVDFVDAVCWNMNYHVTNNPRGIDSGWTRGSVVDTDYLTLTFGSISCRDAITQIATAFNAEFFFSGSGKTINFVDHIENETGLIFVQGRGNGLYSVSQQNVDTKDTITRVYPVGGNQNVPNAYADEDGNLKLPELYLQNTSEYSRIVEKRVVFEDVFPHFVGDVESVAGANNVELVCSDIDFDLNEIAVGSNARINFLTGSLMGISFQFQFDFATKKVTLIPQNDDTALVNDDGTTPQVPQALKKAVVGDKFNFTGVVMPVQYVNAAITKLREKGTTWLSFYSRKRVKFGLDIDYRWMRDKQALNPGDLVTIQIPERGVDKTIRISEINTNLYDGQLNATVSNYRDENWQKKVEGAISSLQTTVSGGGSGSGGVDILERYDERPSSDRNVMSSLRSEKNFLRKDATDTAAERITFEKGAVVRDLATKDFVQDKFAGAGAGIYEDSQGNTVIEVDKLNVRKEAWFNEIVINQIRFQGGIVVYSAATLEVLSVVDGGTYLQVHFDTKEGQLANQFAVDDQIRCQRFSGGNVIKYYMSRVTSIGTDYIRLSKTDIDGTLNVEVGDAIVQFGNRTNTARQSLIEVNVLDGGKQTFYQNVNSYNLTNKNYLELGRMLVDGQWKNMIRSYGGAYLGNRDLSSYIQYNETTGKIEIKASVEFLGVDGSYKTVDQAIEEAQTENTNYVDAIKADLQSQIDGNITSFFYDYAPTLANIPASSWNPDSVKDIHLGDLFYWTSKGYAYRFQKVSGVYSWTKIADTDVTKALADAAKAQDTADGKRRVFVSQPTTPYDLGDLWSQGTSGDLMKCKTAKTIAQSYSAADWEKASKYTDDTAVNNLQIGGVNLFSYKQRSVVNYFLQAFSDVDVLAPYGFSAVGLNGNSNGIVRLQNVITSNGFYTLSFELRSSQSIAYPVTCDICDTGQKIFYTKADNTWSQCTMTVEVTNYGDGSTYNFVDFAGFGWAWYYVRNIMVEKGNKATSFRVSPIDTQLQIDESKALLADIASDGKLTPNEKQQVNREWTAIQKEVIAIDEQCAVLGLDDTDLNDTYADFLNWYFALQYYLSPLLANLTTTSDIVSATFNTLFSNCYLGLEAQKKQIALQLNAQSKSLDFMKSAVENGSAEFNGGLGLINLLFQKTLNGIVNGGMSGLEGDNVLNWGGSTYQQVLADAAKAFGAAMSSAFLNKEDGGGHMAFGKIAWDMLGKLLVGNFEIINGNIIGKDSQGAEKIRLSTENVPEISSLTNNYTYAATDVKAIGSCDVEVLFDDQTSDYYIQLNSGSQSANVTVSVTIPYATNLIVEAGTLDSTENGGVVTVTGMTQSVVVKNAGGTTIASGNTGAALTIPSAGTYSVIITTNLGLADNGFEQVSSVSFTSHNNIKYSENVKKTAIGLDGLYSYFSEIEHFYFKSGTGLRYRGAIDVPAGLGGGRVSSTGSISGLWGILTKAGNGASKSGSDYTITHYIGNTDYSLILTPKSSNVPYFLDANRGANTIIATCSGGFDFVLIRTK